MNLEDIHGIDRHYALLIKQRDGSVRCETKIFAMTGIGNEAKRERRFFELISGAPNIRFCFMNVKF